MVGTISAVYTVALTATKLEATPFVRTRSPIANPVTPSLKVTITGNGLRFVTEGAVDVIRTVGSVMSYVRESVAEAVLPLPA
jgi:hypothetical protein